MRNNRLSFEDGICVCIHVAGLQPLLLLLLLMANLTAHSIVIERVSHAECDIL